MPFDTLPNFPEGGVGRSSDGAGLPADLMRQSLQQTGSDLITQTLRPEDTPAVQAVLGTEVDTLLGSLGQLSPPQQTGQVPGQPDTTRQQVPGQPDTTQRPAVPSGDLEERIRRVMQKYGENPEEIAKALVYSNKARTEATQDVSGVARQVAQLANDFQNFRQNFATTPPANPAYRQATGYHDPTEPNSTPPIDADAFLRNPIGVLGPAIEEITNRVMKENILAYSEAQRQFNKQQRFEQLRAQNSREEAILSPIMDQIYQEMPQIYNRIGQDEAYELLMQQARDRLRGMKGEAFLQEIQQEFGGNGAPIPGQTGGALPRPGVPTARVQPGAPANWSETQAFNRLWKSQTPLEEDRALQAILRERNFGEDIPIR